MNDSGLYEVLSDTNLNNILIMKEVANRSIQTAASSLSISSETANYIKDLNLLSCKKIANNFSENGLLLTPLHFEISFRQNLTAKEDILAQTGYAVATSLFKRV